MLVFAGNLSVIAGNLSVIAGNLPVIVCNLLVFAGNLHKSRPKAGGQTKQTRNKPEVLKPTRLCTKVGPRDGGNGREKMQQVR